MKPRINDIVITPQMLNMITEIDEFSGKWKAGFGQLSNVALQTLKRVATIESVGSSNRIEGNKLSDEEIEDITFLERGFLSKIGGDCHLPIGAYASKTENGYNLKALFGDESGEKLASVSIDGNEASEELVYLAVKEIKKKLENL